MAPLLGLSIYLATMGFESSNDLEFGMAVINVLPSDGKVIDEGPVGCLLMFAVMTFVISILDCRPRFFDSRMPDI